MLDFEKSFGDFIDRREYDQAQSALFSIVRISFNAGWVAAGGNPAAPQKIVELIHPNQVIPPEDHPDSIKNRYYYAQRTITNVKRRSNGRLFCFM